jgi:TRAP-type mannitol/chloroaromatic compound transport system permease small subunit
MRTFLDRLYQGALYLAALCLLIIGVLVAVQLAGRILDGALRLVGFEVLGWQILSLAEIAGYLLAAASFLALAPTLKAGAHIRVTMLLAAISETKRRYLELAAFAFASLACAYMTWNLAHFAWVSFRFNEVSHGVVRVPLAYPQSVMAIGALILTIALIDEFIVVLRNGGPTFRKAEESITLDEAMAAKGLGE